MTDVTEIIKLLEKKLAEEYILKIQMKQCDEMLKEQINTFKTIYNIEELRHLALEQLKITQIKSERKPIIDLSEISNIEYACTEISSACSDLNNQTKNDFLRVKELQCQLLHIDNVREIIQSLKDNIIDFEKIVSDLLSNISVINDDISLVQIDETETHSKLDYQNFKTENPVEKQPEYVDYIINEVQYTNTRQLLDKIAKVMNYDDPLNLNKVSKNIFVCNVCNAEFPSKWARRMHKRKNHTTVDRVYPTKQQMLINKEMRENAALTCNNQYTCDICQKGYSGFIALRSHMQIIHRKYLKCKTCGKKYAQHSRLKQHELVHKETFKTVYSCDICSSTFNSKGGITYHIMTHYPSIKPTCKICGRTFSRNEYLNYHMLSEHGSGKPLRCNKCSQFFTKWSELKRHKKEFHGKNIIKNKAQPGNKDGLFKCNHCHKAYQLLSALKRHTENIHNEKTDEFDSETRKCVCEICGMRCSTRETLKQHKYSHSPEVHKCEICNKQFLRKLYLYIHFSKFHATNKEFVCNICHKKYVTKHRFESHKCSNPAKKALQLTCEICNKHFASPANLDRHILGHQNIKPYHCHICSKDFLEKRNFEYHLQVHDGLKPYSKYK